MADWYVSSVNYAAVPVWTATTAFTVGQFVRPSAPPYQQRFVLRCTTAGTTGATEPGVWNYTQGSTTTSGTAVFTNVTGNSTYNWTAAAGDIVSVMYAPYFLAGDRIFIGSDHVENQTTGSQVIIGSGPFTGSSTSFTAGQVLSVNRAGSIPPVAADLLPGASITVTNTSPMRFECFFSVYHYGVTYIYAGSSNSGFEFGNLGLKTQYFDRCQLNITGTSATIKITCNISTGIILNNTTLSFGNVSQSIQGVVGTGGYLFDMVWLNTLSAITGATIPNVLFSTRDYNAVQVTARGVDLSAVTGTLVRNSIASNTGSKFLFDSCRIAAGVTRYSTTNTGNVRDVVELINCYDGTRIISESYQPSGVVTTERSITLQGGAVDDVGLFSHKMVSNANSDKWVTPLNGFWIDVEFQAVGVSRTAMVEIVSNLTLNNDDISLLLEYQGTIGSSIASFSTTLPSTILSGVSTLSTSSLIWNGIGAIPGATTQRLLIVFTPRLAGRIRGLIRLGRISTTVYYNPYITIT